MANIESIEDVLQKLFIFFSSFSHFCTDTHLSHMSKWKISIFTISPTHALFFQREEKYTEQVRCDQSVCSCVCVFTSVGVICKAKPFNYSHVFIIHNDKSLSIPLFCRRILCNFAIILRVAIRR